MTEVLNQNISLESRQIRPEDVHGILQRRMLIDGFDFVLDYERSRGVNLVDAKTGDVYLDLFSFFGSSPLGINHPKLQTPEYIEKISVIARNNKPSNSDIYTVEMAEFVDTFSRIAVPETFKYLFFIDGGSAAVENALKVAFDWKTKKNSHNGKDDEKGTQILHFR